MFFESLDPIERVLPKNILKIELIESGSLATFWSDWRSVTKVIANFLTPF